MSRLNAENIKNFLYELNEKQIPKKRFNSKILYNVTGVPFFYLFVGLYAYCSPFVFYQKSVP